MTKVFWFFFEKKNCFLPFASSAGELAPANDPGYKLVTACAASRATCFCYHNDWTLDVATREHSPALSQIRQCQELDPVRDSPQYKNLERSIGLVP